MTKDPIIKLAAFAEDVQRLAKKHGIDFVNQDGQFIFPEEVKGDAGLKLFRITFAVKK